MRALRERSWLVGLIAYGLTGCAGEAGDSRSRPRSPRGFGHGHVYAMGSLTCAGRGVPSTTGARAHRACSDRAPCISTVSSTGLPGKRSLWRTARTLGRRETRGSDRSVPGRCNRHRARTRCKRSRVEVVRHRRAAARLRSGERDPSSTCSARSAAQKISEGTAREATRPIRPEPLREAAAPERQVRTAQEWLRQGERAEGEVAKGKGREVEGTLASRSASARTT
jgi:hypothetical protein